MASIKYKDPVSGNMVAVSVKVGDTLPTGTIVEYAGSTVPDGWELIDDSGTYLVIKKVGSVTPTQGNIVSAYSVRTTDAYSASYINGVLGDIETVLTTLTTGGGVS